MEWLKLNDDEKRTNSFASIQIRKNNGRQYLDAGCDEFMPNLLVVLAKLLTW